MDGIEYIFCSGDGLTETWVTPADLDLDSDGVLDAVALDFDGDGLRDDALWDRDGDGYADVVIVNGGTDWYTDPAGDGTWSGYREDGSAFAGGPTVVADPAPGILVDTDADGILDTALTDTDGDGLLDSATARADWSGWAAPPR